MAQRNYSCPLEKMVGDALDARGLHFFHESEGDPICAGLDFYVPRLGCHVEVKRFHTDRIARQLSQAENVIVLQGIHAVQSFCKLILHTFASPTPEE